MLSERQRAAEGTTWTWFKGRAKTELARGPRAIPRSRHRTVTIAQYAATLHSHRFQAAMMLLRLLVAATLVGASQLVAAQSGGAYPAKPIHLVVPFPPGAGTDTVARVVAQKLGESM